MDLKAIPLNYGYDYDRIVNHPPEAILAHAWAVNENVNETLKVISGRNLTKAELAIAATAIQWLGTNCGYSWLQNVLRAQGLYLTTFNHPEPDDWRMNNAKDDAERLAEAIRYGQRLQDWLPLHAIELQTLFDLCEPN